MREPAVALAGLGYALLVEKPLACATEEECAGCGRRRGQPVSWPRWPTCCDTPYTRLLKELLDGGGVGEVISVQHLEPVGFCITRNSYVHAANWRREDEAAHAAREWLTTTSTLSFVVGRRCVGVSSFGSLAPLPRRGAPPGAADRCLECPTSRAGGGRGGGVRGYARRGGAG
jgi:hypothetical protein